MEKNTISRKNAINYVLTNYAEMPSDVRETLEKLYASLDKPRANKPSAKQIENANLVERIFDSMEVDVAYKVKDIAGLSEDFGALSNQKISSLMKNLVDSGRVVRISDRKGVSYKRA